MYSVLYLASLSFLSVHITRRSQLCGTSADVTQLAQADAMFEEFNVELVAKKDEESEGALWNNRLFPVQKLHSSP